MTTLRDFIKQNRKQIDESILRVSPNNRLNDDERRLWILNDEGLYRWAKNEKVRI